MSQYSETLGSFLRNGNFPLEADYIFSSEEALKEFYSDPTKKVTLHKGLLKIVAQDNKQTLYWVTKKQTNEELEFTKLIEADSIPEILESLDDLVNKLNQEIEERKAAINGIYGTEDPTELPNQLSNIKRIIDAIQVLQNTVAYKEELKAVVGTNQDDIINYLSTLDYQNLTQLSNKLADFLQGQEPDDNLQNIINFLYNTILGTPVPTDPFKTLRGIEDVITTLNQLLNNRIDNLQTELDQTQVGVGLSGDGAYNADRETYYLQDATSVMNALRILDSLINQAINNCNLQVADTNTVNLDLKKEATKTTISANVALSPVLGNDILAKSDGLYCNIDSEYQDGVLTVKVNGNIRQQHVLGLSSVVDRAYYDPAQEAIIIVFKLQNGNTQTVTIPAATLISEWIADNSDSNKVVEITKVRVVNGPDKLSADVRISTSPNNILEKQGNTLLVDGTPIKDLEDDVVEEVNRAKLAEQQLQSQLDNIQISVDTALKNAELDVVTTESVELIKKVGDNNRNQLSARARIAVLKENILEQTTEGLLVRGTSDNITHKGESLEEFIERLDSAQVPVYENMTHALQHESKEGSIFLVSNSDDLGEKGFYTIVDEQPTRVAFTSELKKAISDLRDEIQIKLDELDWYWEE